MDLNACCVVHTHTPAVEVCVLGGEHRHAGRGVVLDFCGACIDAGEHEDNFGRCYVCRDFQDHAHCIGVPCQCPCEGPTDVGQLDNAIAAAEERLSELRARREACQP